MLIMGKNKLLSSDVIAQNIALRESGLQTKQVAEQIGVSHRSVRRWFSKFHENGGRDLPTHAKRLGRALKTSPRAMNIVKRELESNPRMTARKLKESNPEVFGNVSIRTVNRHIETLGYTSHRAIKKPMLKLTQRRKRVDLARLTNTGKITSG